jgi:hypothetical protein
MAAFPVPSPEAVGQETTPKLPVIGLCPKGAGNNQRQKMTATNAFTVDKTQPRSLALEKSSFQNSDFVRRLIFRAPPFSTPPASHP